MGELIMGEEMSGMEGVPIAVLGVEGVAEETSEVAGTPVVVLEGMVVAGLDWCGIVGTAFERSGVESVSLLFKTTADLRTLIFAGRTGLTFVLIGDKSEVFIFSAPLPKLSSRTTLSLILLALTKSATA